jgi:Asp-tRNA(Asn)/Glu-tRNA(Gln) amidotransferase A subunit family amidase
MFRRTIHAFLSTTLCVSLVAPGLAAPKPASPAFGIEEASIADIQAAIRSGRVTTAGVVRLYLERIHAYNGQCVREPQGLLGPISTIPDAGQVNALGTLNLRPATRRALGFDAHKARSLTDAADTDPTMPDALEIAAAQDREFARTGKLVGPLQGVVVAIKDQFDTRDMRTTNGQQVAYANDRPPRDSTVVERLRKAGAIILAKANRGSYQGRSPFGGTVCNPYDTERTPRGSSAGSAVAVSINLVTCAIGEETGTSIRSPAGATNVVGLAPTQELISRAGMSGPGISVRQGPICRTAEDTARILGAVVGYDSKDPLTAFSIGRLPEKPYADYAGAGSLAGLRIGVVREFMDLRLFGKRDEEAIGIVDAAIGELRKTGATIVDPGKDGALFTQCFQRYAPQAFGKLFTAQHPELFPVDKDGKPTRSHVETLVDLARHPDNVPDKPNIREIGTVNATGDSSYWRSLYLAERGDAKVRTEQELVEATKPIADPEFWASSPNISTETPYGTMKGPAAPSYPPELDMADRIYQRFAFQQVVLACFADQTLDAVVYPTMNIPPLKIQAPEEPAINGRNQAHWTIFGQQGFPAITVPAGFTRQVYDRVPDATSPDGTRLVGPVPARLPIGIDFAARPFAEPVLLRIAAAFEAVGKHRAPAAAFTGLPKR